MGVSSTFHKLEKLSDKKLIDAIFQKKGDSIFSKPILFIYLKAELSSPFPCQVLFSASKRKFKKAVDRNKVKRLLRESYRLNKHKIYKAIGSNQKYAICVLYLDNEIASFEKINNHLTLAIDEFNKRLS
jgi:ribonuclease P protein component